MSFYKGEKLENLGLLPDMGGDQFGTRTSIYFRDEEASFIDLSRRSSKFASGLIKEGVEPGDRVAFYIPNSIQFVESFFGTIKAGAIPVPLNLRMPPRTLSYVVENSEADILIGSNLDLDHFDPEIAERLYKETDVEKLIMQNPSSEEIIDYSRLIEQGDSDYEHVNQEYDETAVQIYTSGTTGKPKGALLSHENVLSAVEGLRPNLPVDVSSTTLLVTPLYHVYSLTSINVCMSIGSKIVLQANPDPSLIMKNMEKHQCDTFVAVPALFRMMRLVYTQAPEEFDLNSLEKVISGGAPLDETTKRKAKDEWKVRFIQGWGMTENVTCGSLNPDKAPKGAGCVGWPLGNTEMKLVDPETRETIVPWNSIAPWGKLEEDQVGKEGEMAIRGPVVFKGYYQLPDKNEEAFDDEDWFYTGDMMKIDEDKALWVIGRTDDMMLSGGEKIYPSEVEDALMEHPEISDAAVVPAPHKTKGEAPVAFVVLSEDSELTEKEIKEFSLERVPTYAHPRRVFFKNNLPKSGSLKTQHYKLEEEAKEKLSEPLGKYKN